MSNRVILVGHRKGDIIRKDTELELYNLQYYVDGFIEPCAPAELRAQGIELLCNEEGLLQQLPYNENFFPFFFVGRLVILAVDGDRFTGLSDKQERFALDWLRNLPEI